MSRVITFSRVFPSYHPKAGQPTFFVEKIWESIGHGRSYSEFVPKESYWQLYDSLFKDLTHPNIFPKHHTIRAGHRWKEGDKFSPRVWSGKPYNSPQITIAQDIEIVKTWEIEIAPSAGGFPTIWVERTEAIYGTDKAGNVQHLIGLIDQIAENDGLSRKDLLDWFRFPKPSGPMQIICWNPEINY